MAQIFALVTADGTAASETAVCAEHTANAPTGGYDDIPEGPLVDCTGNDALACITCGATGE